MADKETLESYAQELGFGAEVISEKPQVIKLKGKCIRLRMADAESFKIKREDITKIDYIWLVSLNLLIKVSIIKDKDGDDKVVLCNVKDGKTEEVSCDKLEITSSMLKNGFEEFDNTADTIEAIRRDLGLCTMKEKFKQIIDGKESKQIIFTGAPGTGKTYTARKMAVYYCLADDIENNFDDIKATIGNEKCDILKEKPTENDLSCIIDDKECYKKLVERYCNNSDKARIEFVQFHSSYDYTDFVEGLRPVPLKDGENPTFVKMDGVFKSFCRKAAADKSSNRYFFIIDEINRADLSKVFGELMFGLEESYRGENNAFRTQYQNLPTYEANMVDDKLEFKPMPMKEDKFGKGFYIPENVYIIGTMNDIDRSVEAFDFALRRRFRWVMVDADDEMQGALKEMLSMENSKIDNIIERAQKLNEVISQKVEFGLSKDFALGPAYFKEVSSNDINDLNKIWESKIEPILREYCRGNGEKKVNDFIEQDCRKAFFEIC